MKKKKGSKKAVKIPSKVYQLPETGARLKYDGEYRGVTNNYFKYVDPAGGRISMDFLSQRENFGNWLVEDDTALGEYEGNKHELKGSKIEVNLEPDGEPDALRLLIPKDNL